uniref:Putative salivary secreted protein salivary gland overexpressed n=1 Tax=Rhipicephalus microplus TaxID=6941 RepID=A0A6M2CSI2_RHIMP
MWTFCVIMLASASYVSKGSPSSSTPSFRMLFDLSPVGISDANTFVDNIFKDNQPPRVRESPRLYPYATIGDFIFTVPKNRITNRDLTVNMTHGEVRGLDTALRRKGDCEVPFFHDGRTVVSCDLVIQGLNITFTSLVKGDSLMASWKTIWVNVDVADSNVHFEAITPVGPGIGILRAFHIVDITLDVTYDNNLSLNKGRSEKFKEEIATKVEKELRRIFFEYKSLLPRSVELYRNPIY